MNIINNDTEVKPLPASKYPLVERVFKHYECSNTVHLYETIHGHVAMFHINEGRFIPHHRDSPARLDAESLKFWNDIAPELRWFEIGCGVISIAL